jgi:hypothetical protein
VLPRLIKGRTRGPVFVTHRKPGPGKVVSAQDVCPATGLARLSYGPARALLDQHTALGGATGTGWTCTSGGTPPREGRCGPADPDGWPSPGTQWLSQRNSTLASCGQIDIDAWYAESSEHGRTCLRAFLNRAMQSRRCRVSLSIPR